ncbi:uncharacterized protein LOC131321123 [Rhododendron vialii]|uniref:uncharacterized protein LOC131321123 n=1 Tax=Rhododendron vialii TaxID=182163 RepID=UPI00265F4CE6|nr:uncharacterized protein LOC131321123 [Rhododendron vialii]
MANQYFVQESGLREYPSEEMERFNLIRWKSGKSVDPRLFALLEKFKEIYIERHEFFTKIFPGHQYDEFAELFKKIAGVSSTWDDAKARTMTRSLSCGSRRGANQGDESTLRLERFKVRILDLGGVPSSGHGDK